MPSRRPSSRSGRPPDGWWPPASKPIAVEGGVTARSKRGQIGDSWWSRRFITVLESFGIGSRLQRGKRYARTGQVLNLEIVPGQVRASVQGSRSRPYRVFIETEILTDSQWASVEDVMASRAVFLAKLLSGEMPEEIEEAFVESSTTLFPASDVGPRLRVFVPRLGEPVQARGRCLLSDGGSLRRRSLPHLRLAGAGQGKVADRAQGATGAVSGAADVRGGRSGERRSRHRSVRMARLRCRAEGYHSLAQSSCRSGAARGPLGHRGPAAGAGRGRPDPPTARPCRPSATQRSPGRLRPLYEEITTNAIALAFGEESTSPRS